MSATRLTRAAAQKFATMCDNADELHARVHALLARIKTAEAARANLLTTKDEKAIAELSDEIERLSGRRAAQQEAYNHAMRVIATIRTWLSSLSPAVELQDFGAVTPTVKFVDPETATEAIDYLRAEIMKLRSLRNVTLRAIPPLNDAYLAASKRVDELAARGRPTVGVDRGVLQIRFPVDTNFSSGSAKDALAIQAWLHTAEMKEKLHKEIEQMMVREGKVGTPVMSIEERDKKIAEIDRMILGMEREEEHLITVGENYHLHAPRRADADPRAVLCVIMKQRAARHPISPLDAPKEHALARQRA